MSNSNSNSNYSGRQANTSAYIKTFVNSSTPSLWTILNYENTSTTPPVPVPVAEVEPGNVDHLRLAADPRGRIALDRSAHRRDVPLD